MKNFFCKKNTLVGCFLLAFFVSLPTVLAQGEGDFSVPASGKKLEFALADGSSWCLTDTECSFTLVLPDIVPSQVGFENPTGISGVTLLSATKNLWVEGLNSGTSIELVFSFSQSGQLELPPLAVQIDGVPFAIPFAPVEVFPNPKSLKPQVQLIFHDEQGNERFLFQEEALQGNYHVQDGSLLQVIAGEPLVVTLSLRYGSALSGLTWDLSPEALFQQLASYQEDWNQGATELSHEFQPVAQFRYIPLKTGSVEFPSITLEVQGYDEELHTLGLGNFPVLSLPPQATHDASNNQDAETLEAFALAFSPPAQVEEAPSVEVQPEIAQELAALRWKERMSFPWSSAYQQRQKLEQELGLSSSKGEASLLLGWFGVGIALATLVLTVISIFRRKGFFSIILGFFCILVFVLTMVYLKPSFQSSGILAANNLSRIPEPVATHLFPVTPYSVVRIQDEVLGWYYVEAAGLEGWIPKEMVIPIHGKIK